LTTRVIVVAAQEPDAKTRQIERLGRWLNSTDQQTRLDAVRELSNLPQPDALPLILVAIKDPASDVRAAAAWSLERFPDPHSIAALRVTLKDQDDRVRAASAWAISHIGGSAVLPDVEALITDSSPLARFRAVWGLGIIGDRAALPVVVNALTDQNSSVRERAALLSLEMLKDNSLLPRLLKLANHPQPETRRIIMYLLARYGNASVIPVLEAGLKDADPLVRGEAALSLGKLKARTALKDLAGAFADPDDHVRGSAAYAMELIGDPAAMDALRPLLKDQSAFVQAVAAEALLKLGDKTVKPPEGFKAAELFTFPIYSPEHKELYQ